jgi:glucokinase
MKSRVRHAVALDLSGSPVKYAMVDYEGVTPFYDRLPSRAGESADAVVGQLVAAVESIDGQRRF